MKHGYLERWGRIIGAAFLSAALMLGGCAGEDPEGNIPVIDKSIPGSAGITSGNNGSLTNVGTVSSLDVNDMFSDRDKEIGYEESECVLISLNGSSASCDSTAVTIDGSTIIIQEKGSYLLRGTLENGSIRVDAAEDAKVQVILDGAEISCLGSAALYCKQADKVFLTLAPDSSNQITNTGSFTAIDSNHIDGAVFSKCDLTLNGTGSLTVSSQEGHGIVTKDDLAVTGGTYQITSGDHGISGKDSIRIADGNISITCAEDGLHSGNGEDPEKGYVYIEGGNITISAGDDGIHGESKAVISGGRIDILKSYEGIEAAVIEIAGGVISLISDDDGLNATDGSGSDFGGGFFNRGNGAKQQSQEAGTDSEVYLLISGGKLLVNASGDGIDSNGALYVTGGEVYVSGPENSGNGVLDYDSKGEITGGSILAVGTSGMAMNFSSATQGSALVTTASTHVAGEKVELKNSQGNVLLSYFPTSKFNSVLVSCPEMMEGETFTLTVGSEIREFTMDQLIYGNSSGFGGGHGGMGGWNGQGGKDRPDRRNPEENPEMPEFPEGGKGGFEEMPQPPEGDTDRMKEMPRPSEGDV